MRPTSLPAKRRCRLARVLPRTGRNGVSAYWSHWLRENGSQGAPHVQLRVRRAFELHLSRVADLGRHSASTTTLAHPVESAYLLHQKGGGSREPPPPSKALQQRYRASSVPSSACAASRCAQPAQKRPQKSSRSESAAYSVTKAA